MKATLALRILTIGGLSIAAAACSESEGHSNPSPAGTVTANAGSSTDSAPSTATSGGRGDLAGGGASSVAAAGGRLGSSPGGTTSGPAAGGGAEQTTAPTGACRNTRLTTYSDNNDLVGCGYHRALPVIPQLVRDWMYFAMSEPFYGSSYNGASGEACGECWELTTASTTAIVMVADLCPVEGNPPCADPNQMNFDLVEGAADRFGSQGWDQAVARPVACPISGNIQIEVLDRSWAYFQAAVFNFRIPLRLVEFQPVGGSTWTPMTRVFGSAWHNMDDQNPAFNSVAAGADANGAGVTLRLTSAQGQVLTSTVVLGSGNSGTGKTVDLGIQFENLLSVAQDQCRL